MQEQWRSVVGWVGYYEVSNAGRVRSLARRITRQGQPDMQIKSKVLKTHVNRRLPYEVVGLHRDGKAHSRYVHRLVLEAFVGPCPSGHEALHNNGKSTDNNLTNLRWGTHTDNVHDQIRHGTLHRPPSGHRQTVCARGHEQNDTNTYYGRTGYGQCRPCQAQRARERRRDA